MAVSREHILDEIKRTAHANGGVPLGRIRFFQETGIKESDWLGKIWIRWGDAVQEAGFVPNQLQTAYDETELLQTFAAFIRELGHFPVEAELRMKARADNNFPSHGVFARFGSKQRLASRLLQQYAGQLDYTDVAALCAPVANPDGMGAAEMGSGNSATSTTIEGYVYMALLKLGREKRYKIGKAVLVARRTDQISVQLPEDLQLIHAIQTDDAYGIEDYWHKRFDTKRAKGEWFSLSSQDVMVFRRRKFM